MRSRRKIWAGNLALVQGKREMHTMDSEGKRPFVRPWCRWDYNLKIYLSEVGWQTEN
jgi:hypothetical protein